MDAMSKTKGRVNDPLFVLPQKIAASDPAFPAAFNYLNAFACVL